MQVYHYIAYDRNDESLIPLNDVKRDTILSTVNVDWTRQIISDLTVDDLDKNAILKAREQSDILRKDNLLMDKLPDNLNIEQKKRKINKSK